MTASSQAEAVFLSDLQPLGFPSVNDVANAIRRSLQTYHGAAGCLAAFATEYGEHPETSALRMRWALSLLLPTEHPDHPIRASDRVAEETELRATRAHWHTARTRLMAAETALDRYASAPPQPVATMSTGCTAAAPATHHSAITERDEARTEFIALGGYFATHI